MTDPLTTAEIHLDNLPGFILDTDRLMPSDLMDLSTGDEFKAAVRLWCKAWKQTPTGSLPNDDRALARFAGVSDAQWPSVKAMALRGFVLCTDGRLYHPILCADAIRAWNNRQANQKRTDAASKARWKDRDDIRDGLRDGVRNDIRNGERNGYPDGQRNEVPSHLHLSTNKKENPKTDSPEGAREEEVPRGTIEQSKPESDPDRRWHYEKREGWVQELQSVGCKIGPNNWLAWQGLVQRLTLIKIQTGALRVPADDRWPDRVEVATKAIPAPSAPLIPTSTLKHLAQTVRDLDAESTTERQRVIAYLKQVSDDHMDRIAVQLESIPGGPERLRGARHDGILNALGLHLLCKVPEIAAVAAGRTQPITQPLAATSSP